MSREGPSPLLTLRDVAGRWSVSPRTVQRLAKRGALRFLRIGRQRRFRLEDVIAFERAARS